MYISRAFDNGQSAARNSCQAIMEELQLRRFLSNLQPGDKALYRKYEKTYLSIISTSKAISFNEKKMCCKCIRSISGESSGRDME